MAVGVRPNQGAAVADTAPGAALLFEQYSQRVLAYCLYVLRDHGEAEDAVQTTFLNAHRALERGVVPEHEYAWLHSIAKNVCRTQQRTSARRAPIATGVDVNAIPGRGDALDDEQDLAQGLGAALASLPERQRRALLLREWHGLSSDEVAATLGMSAPATYALLTRARRSLATALTTTVRRPLSSLNIGFLADTLRTYLKPLFGSAASKTAVAAVAATAAVGGVVAERSLGEGPARPTGISVTSPAGGELASLSSRPDRMVETRVNPRGAAGTARSIDATTTRKSAPTLTNPTRSGPAPPLEPSEPASPVASAPETIESEHVPDPASATPTLELPLLPDLSSGDSLLPPVEVPPLPPVPESPLEEPPQLPPLPPLPPLSPLP